MWIFCEAVLLVSVRFCEWFVFCWCLEAASLKTVSSSTHIGLREIHLDPLVLEVAAHSSWCLALLDRGPFWLEPEGISCLYIGVGLKQYIWQDGVWSSLGKIHCAKLAPTLHAQVAKKVRIFWLGCEEIISVSLTRDDTSFIRPRALSVLAILWTRSGCVILSFECDYYRMVIFC